MAIRQTVDIIKKIVSQLNYTFLISSIVANTDGTFTLNSANTYYCSRFGKVTILGLDYDVVSIVYNVSITIKPDGHTGSPVGETSFELLAPEFFHGTVNSTNTEITKRLSPTYPIVYLNESLRERMIADESSPLERTAPIKIYFLGLASYEDNDNPAFLEEILKPLSNIEEKFYALVDRDINLAKITEDWNRTGIARFGRTNENGVTETIFKEQLSGLELEITLPIEKCCNC